MEQRAWIVDLFKQLSETLAAHRPRHPFAARGHIISQFAVQCALVHACARLLFWGKRKRALHEAIVGEMLAPTWVEAVVLKRTTLVFVQAFVELAQPIDYAQSHRLGSPFT